MKTHAFQKVRTQGKGEGGVTQNLHPLLKFVQGGRRGQIFGLCKSAYFMNDPLLFLRNSGNEDKL